MRQLVEKNEWELTHFPDVVTSDKKIAIEFEKTQKSNDRLEENVMQNFKHFDMQIWYIPKNSKSLFEALKELKEKHLLNMHILFIEDLQKNLYKDITLKRRKVIKEEE